MKKIKLNEDWMFFYKGDKVYKTQVPCSVYSILLEQGVIKDPYYRDNELEVLKIMDDDFVFTRKFVLNTDEVSDKSMMLELEGIDTLADIFLNDILLGHCDNMHRSWQYSVHDIVRCGENVLRIKIYSPTEYIAKAQEKVYTGGSNECMEGFPQLRKAHCMFGWDWGPRLPDAGIFRNVNLIFDNESGIDTVYVTQKHLPGNVVLELDAAIHGACDGENIICSVCEASGDGATIEVITDVICLTDMDRPEHAIVHASLNIDNPKLWWPNGYGSQTLYSVSVILTDKDGKERDKWTRRIGLRTLTVNTDKDEWGRCFAHEVNGVKIFAMGADYIPEDNILPRTSEARTRRLLEDAVLANYNCIRVWGGGYYPDDYFYDICDELGLLVWQDLMFACASYELCDSFDHNIRKEIKENVIRLRHHACLALWCGNNEMETQTLDKCWKPSIKQVADYIKIFEYIIPDVLKETDPNTFFWPSSPSSGGNFDNPWDESRGDCHYWDVWHGEKPFTDYRRYHYRYLSEFGFQSFPCMETVVSFTEPEDRNIFSRVMEMHQRNVAANGKILKYIAATYLYPTSFDMLLYCSQLLQADAIRYGVEHFRRNRGRCMGAVVWQLNDIWPVASWSSIDYYGRWKALHYAEKRMFAPVMISAEEHGELDQRPYCITQRRKIEKSARLNVANETMSAVQGTVKCELRDNKGAVLQNGQQHLSVPALESVWLEKLEFNDCDELSNYVSYAFEYEGGESSGTCLFTAPKHFKFVDPGITVSIRDNKLNIKSKYYAKCVEIMCGSDVLLSDNFFDMNPGEVTVDILRGKPKTDIISTRSVYDIR